MTSAVSLIFPGLPSQKAGCPPPPTTFVCFPPNTDKLSRAALDLSAPWRRGGGYLHVVSRSSFLLDGVAARNKPKGCAQGVPWARYGTWYRAAPICIENDHGASGRLARAFPLGLGSCQALHDVRWALKVTRCCSGRLPVLRYPRGRAKPPKPRTGVCRCCQLVLSPALPARQRESRQQHRGF